MIQALRVAGLLFADEDLRETPALEVDLPLDVPSRPESTPGSHRSHRRVEGWEWRTGDVPRTPQVAPLLPHWSSSFSTTSLGSRFQSAVPPRDGREGVTGRGPRGAGV